MGTKVGPGLVGLAAWLLLGAAACGDDDNGSIGTGSSAGQDGGGAGESGAGTSTIDACSLLEVAEIEAQFGEQGTVGEGQQNPVNCIWEVEDGSGQLTGQVTLFVWRPGTDHSLTDVITGDGMIEVDDLVPVADIGDEAFFEGPDQPVLYVRSGEVAFSLFAVFNDDVAGAQDKVLTLAGEVVGRL